MVKNRNIPPECAGHLIKQMDPTDRLKAKTLCVLPVQCHNIETKAFTARKAALKTMKMFARFVVVQGLQSFVHDHLSSINEKRINQLEEDQSSSKAHFGLTRMENPSVYSTGTSSL